MPPLAVPALSAPLEPSSWSLARIREIEDILAGRPELTYPPRAGVAFYKGRTLMMLNRDEEAEPLLEQAIELQTAASGGDHLRVADSAWLLGLCRWRQGDREAGLEDMKRAMGIYLRVQGDSSPDYLLYRSFLLADEGRQEEAQQALQAARANRLPEWKVRLQADLHPRGNEPPFRQLVRDGL